MIPKIYDEFESSFTSNGLGSLPQCLSAKVNEVLKGLFEAKVEYPMDGYNADLIKERRFILLKPNDFHRTQPYRIYKIHENNLKKTLIAYCRHWSYDMNGIPVSPFSATGIQPTLSGITSNAILGNQFTFWTDIDNSGTVYNQTVPKSMRAALGGSDGSVLDSFKQVEFEWDRNLVKLYARRGSDRGVTIRYGKNLEKYESDRTTENFYTGCLAYWEKEDEDSVFGDVVFIEDHTDYPTEKIFVLDASSDFEEKPDVEALNLRAQEYIEDNNLGTPFQDSVKIEFTPLWQTEEYKDIAPLEQVELGDTVHVIYNGKTISTRVNEYTYNVLLERYEELKLGAVKNSLADTVAKPIEQHVKTTIQDFASTMEQAIAVATNTIRGGLGGYVVIGTNADGYPNELLIMDKPNKEEADNIIRMNMNGIGFSQNGYAGTFENAWTIDGRLNASFIKTGHLDGGLITSDSIETDSLVVNAKNAVNGTINNVIFDGVGMHIVRKDEETGQVIDSYVDENDNIQPTYRSLFTENGMRVISNLDPDGKPTLSAEKDTVDAINLTAHKYLRVMDDQRETKSRFQGFYNSIHEKPQHGIFWEV